MGGVVVLLLVVYEIELIGWYVFLFLTRMNVGT